MRSASVAAGAVKVTSAGAGWGSSSPKRGLDELMPSRAGTDIGASVDRDGLGRDADLSRQRRAMIVLACTCGGLSMARWAGASGVAGCLADDVSAADEPSQKVERSAATVAARHSDSRGCGDCSGPLVSDAPVTCEAKQRRAAA